MLVVCGFGARDAAAQVYKCRDSSGNLTYLDRPCPETAKVEETPPIDKAPTVYPDDNPPPRKRNSGRTTQSAPTTPRSVCNNLGDGRTPAENVFACARERNLPYGRTWAMTQGWKDAGDGVSTASGYCVATSVMNFSGKMMTLRTYLHFTDDFRWLTRGKERFNVNGLFAPAIDEGAVKACASLPNSGG